ncbi:MAG: beta-N-acetylhexosaminidase [Adhaeribacter sp.]
MKNLFTLLLLLLSALPFQKAAAQQERQQSGIALIPQPQSLKPGSGSFAVTAKTRIYIDPNDEELRLLAGMLADQLKAYTTLQVPVVAKTGSASSKNAIVLTKKPVPQAQGNEGYSLSVRPGNILVQAPQGSGLFYGLQTIYQLLPPDPRAVTGKVSIPALEVVDWPRFGWRGLMLDVGRYFYPVEFIKKYIDYLALHKLNVFHWHLTEDHGWRIEIKKYPKLTEIASKREGTQVGNKEQIDYRPHGGFYTQEQIKDVVAYAAQRYVTVVPEIEMPGHTVAVLVAYPELSCTGGPFKPLLQWGIQPDIYCAGNEQTFTFLEGVLSEVAELFPSKFIHIGGDEAPKARWKACAKCQARIKSENLKDEHELQSYFIRRIENFLLTKNKKIIGWDEILEGGLAPNAAVMSWRGIKGGIAAAKQHHEVVMTPTNFLYLDYYQGDRSLEPKAIGGMLPLEKVYSYEPVPAELTAEESKYIIGTQGNVWAEYIHSPEKVEYMAFPRGAALAEVAWTNKELKDWDSFKERMETQYKRYDALGINYSKSAYNVLMEVKVNPENKEALVSLSTGGHDAQVYYTLDGLEPTREGQKYTGPFLIKNPGTIKATTFRDGKQIGKVTVRTIDENMLTGVKN